MSSYSNIITRPKSKEELFNLRHAQAHCCIEQIFGVFKRRFQILVCPPEFDMDIQARVPSALCMVHNYIRTHDPEDIDTFPEASTTSTLESTGSLTEGPTTEPDRLGVNSRRDQIAERMWASYCRELRTRGQLFTE
ncbi:hypothetical protein SERLA73DRAFT_63827 [Serpula lacrymans var. lacrymans S7.3]|uniref:DDE Tnp4 domain-containing protein n=1 Tax=Serpula lacrymans var. lacrymans (strain S7.3) TaxID=936435 RepID=F8QD82_SERL3|nr:hypothetical protein SERLA73DRAFT_63827 [Serpula lacrymans var. lacrymans S7.3]